MPTYEIRDEQTGKVLGTVQGDIGIHWDEPRGEAKRFLLVEAEEAPDEASDPAPAELPAR